MEAAGVAVAVKAAAVEMEDSAEVVAPARLTAIRDLVQMEVMVVLVAEEAHLQADRSAEDPATAAFSEAMLTLSTAAVARRSGAPSSMMAEGCGF
jgi:hypothetical protein